MIAQEVNVWNMAMQMIEIGLRPPIVHATTGLCKNRLRRIYKEMHGKSASQGRVSEYAYSRLKTRNQVIESTGFYHIYYRLGGDRILRVLDGNLFLKAYREYEISFSPACIDAQTAWYIARDLRENVLEPRCCPECSRGYLYDARSDLMVRCPLCDG